ncbi:uncharacterized protein ACBT57_019528 isoform 1-T1 [Dama dama]
MPCCWISGHRGKGPPIKGTGDEQGHVFKSSKGQPFSREGRPVEGTGHWIVTGTLAPARRAVRQTATGGQCDHVHRATARLQAGAARGGLPGDGRGGFRQETRNRDRGPGCGLGSQIPQTFSEAEGARLERAPGPGAES